MEREREGWPKPPLSFFFFFALALPSVVVVASMVSAPLPRPVLLLPTPRIRFLLVATGNLDRQLLSCGRRATEDQSRNRTAQKLRELMVSAAASSQSQTAGAEPAKEEKKSLLRGSKSWPLL